MALKGKQNEFDSELMLLSRIRERDEQAMRTLYCCYVKYLTAICSRYIYSDEDVKDILQEVFLKIFSSIDLFEYRGIGSLKGWMARITLNESLKFIKRNSQITYIELQCEKMDVPDDAPDTTGVSSSAIHTMIRELPDGYRTIFNLYVIEEKSHKEIAELLNIKESTSASQLHRAKIILADKIKQYRNINSISI